MIYYDNDPDMRAVYLKQNSITHAFSWKEGERNYKLFFGNADYVGFEEGTYSTMRALKADVAKHYPELTETFYRGNH